MKSWMSIAAIPLALLLGSCTTSDAEEPLPTEARTNAAPETPTPLETLETPETVQLRPTPSPEVVPEVDASQHSVPLEDIYFDTFRSINRAVPFTDASPELILRLRDAIPPIHNPIYEPASDADWLAGEDMILGYATQEEAWAFPLRILNYHEIVSDTLAGEPILVSYCPLCFSGIIYSRRLAERVLTFGNTSALYESDMVMFDYETGSYWWQVPGEAIVGELTGAQLTVLPSLTTTWDEWQRLYPETQVLSRQTGFARNYSRDPFANYDEYLNGGNFAFPVSEEAKDARLLPGSRVLAIKVGELSRAYPLLGEANSVINETLGGEDLVVFLGPTAGAGAAFKATLEERRLTFEAREEGYFDLQTGSRWEISGEAIAGKLLGAQLSPIPTRISYWFAIVAAEPEISLYQP
jgi:hypothetical protein